MPVTLVERYNPAWPDWYRRLEEFLWARLDGVVVKVEHVGSTAVPGMTAKPIIDIDIVIDADAFAETAGRLAAAGYVHQGDLGVPGREAFKLPDPELRQDLPPHHLYVCAEGVQPLREHLAFRDFMRRRPDYVKRLSDLKWSLCETHDNDRQAYMDGKAALVQHITALALSTPDDARRP